MSLVLRSLHVHLVETDLSNVRQLSALLAVYPRNVGIADVETPFVHVPRLSAQTIAHRSSWFVRGAATTSSVRSLRLVEGRRLR